MLSECLPFNQVLARVLEIQGALFRINFVKVNTTDPRDIWRSSIDAYEVWEVGSSIGEMHNAFLGHLYINAYARDLKFGHKNSTFCLQPVCSLCGDQSHTPSQNKE